MKAVLHELDPVAHSWWHRQLYFYFSPLVLFRSSLAGSGGAVSRPTLFSYSWNPIIEVRLFPPSYSDACLIVLKGRRWSALNPFNYLFLGEHGSGNVNGTFSKYFL